MATYTGTRAASGVEPIYNAVGDVTVVSTFALSVALATNDLLNMVNLPSGAYIIDVVLSTDALDTNAASTIAYDVGDSNSATRYISNKAQGNNAALAPYHMDQAAGLGYQTGANSGDTTVVVKVHTGPATGATSGTVRLAVTYNVQAKSATS